MGTSLRGSRILGLCGAVLGGVLAAVLSAPSVAAAGPPYVSPVIATPKPARPLDSAAMTGRLALPIPSALHYTTNVATCVAHGGDAESCALLFRANAVALYWSDVGCTLCQLTGFRVRHPAVAFARVGSPPGPVIDQTKAPIVVVPMPPGGWTTGSCFVVTSYSEPVTPMVNDGTGHKIPLPGATPSGRRDESPPSAKLCIGATRRDVALGPTATRHFHRTHWINYKTDNVEHVDDDAPRSGVPFSIGMHYIHNKEDSQVNGFFRSALAFDPSPLGNATVYGGSFAYDADRNCARLRAPAPAGWEGAKWILPRDAAWFPSPKLTGPAIIPVDALLRGWRAGDPKTFVLDSDASAEFVRSGVEGPQFSCRGQVTKVQLVVSTGIDN